MTEWQIHLVFHVFDLLRVQSARSETKVGKLDVAGSIDEEVLHSH